MRHMFAFDMPDVLELDATKVVVQIYDGTCWIEYDAEDRDDALAIIQEHEYLAERDGLPEIDSRVLEFPL